MAKVIRVEGKLATAKERAQSPDANEFGKLRAELAKRGVAQAQISAVIGANVSGKTRATIVELLRDWCKGLPKAK